MKASLESILDVLGKPNVQYVIPVFQRVYSWNTRQCEQLWNDMMRAGAARKMHFMGTLIYLPDEACSEGGFTHASLIDGQQRFTTITLALMALRDELRQKGAASVELAESIDADYLHAGEACKLKLSKSDDAILRHLVDGEELDCDPKNSQFLFDNLEFFRGKMQDSSFDADTLFSGLKELKVVSVELGADDSPQQVFESLNSKGRPLSTTDLLRNTLLVKYGTVEQERLFDVYWAPIDEAFQKFGSEQDIYLDAAIHYWMLSRATGIRAGKRSDLYPAFKEYLSRKGGASLEDMLQSINAACLEFAAKPSSPEMRQHIDWVIDKPKGLVSQRKIFGD
ncbi:DUF262 domain-containing protein [Xiamenia xianingshaonis]|uniref:DUF262 domain-containing protein n=1 Tax=Xiamenia xianingshaonis TaxID=2682776 RepID=A0A9E6SU82_9ACTN|nr:DUF262 domain-containing protein [Xiamenia xianingshaonis]NHM14200.1 DUF262 domain-containing protein [Xiamenia xianingshaonis]QTU84186.1 DUF262 domain-containing protein [Xiamenia xianingshaonis]